MEIDDYRNPNYLLGNLINDYHLSRVFNKFIDEQSTQHDYLASNLKMERYLITKAKCITCLTPQDRRLIYYIEKASYSNYREFSVLPPSHENCKIIASHIEQSQNEPGPALTFSMMLKIYEHSPMDLQQKYNLFRYYRIIVDNNDSMAIDMYIDEYTQLTKSILSENTYSCPIEPRIELPLQNNSQFIIKHYDENFQLDSYQTSGLLEERECFGHRRDKTAVLERPLTMNETIEPDNSCSIQSGKRDDEYRLIHGRDKNVTLNNGHTTSPDLKSRDIGVWPKWPNIFRNVAEVKFV